MVKSAGGLELRGQKNIAYTVLDFSLKNPGLSIYLGSNAEILCLVATLPNFSAMRLACGFEGKDANEFVLFAKKSASTSPRARLTGFLQEKYIHRWK